MLYTLGRGTGISSSLPTEADLDKSAFKLCAPSKLSGLCATPRLLTFAQPRDLSVLPHSKTQDQKQKPLYGKYILLADAATETLV